MARDLLTALGQLLVGRNESVSLRQRLVGSLGGLLGLRVAFGAISFAITVLLARTLGGAGFGTYSYAFAWVTLLGAPAVLGLDQLLVREVAAHVLRKEWGLLRGIIRASNQAVGLCSVGMVVAGAIACWLLRSRMPAGMLATFALAIGLVPLIALTRIRQAVLQGLHRVVLGTIPERLVLPALFLALLAAVSVAGGRTSPAAAMGLYLLATVVAFALGAWLLHRTLPRPAHETAPAYQRAAWARSAFPILLLTGAGVIFAQADTLILGSIKGAAAVGLYGVADKSAELLTFVMVAQNAAFASTTATLYAQGDTVRLQRLSTRIARLTLLLTAPLGLLFILAGDLYLSFFYGSAFAAARGPLVLLSIGQLVNVAAGLNGMLLIMTGHERAAVTVVGTAAAVNIGLNLLLVPRWGPDGAALANLCSLVVWNMLATAALRRRTGIDSTVLGWFGRRTGFAAVPPASPSPPV